VRTFKTVAELMQFYSQDAADLKREYLRQKKVKYIPLQEQEEEQDSEDAIENLFHYKDTSNVLSTCLNNSLAINEIE